MNYWLSLLFFLCTIAGYFSKDPNYLIYIGISVLMFQLEEIKKGMKK